MWEELHFFANFSLDQTQITLVLFNQELVLYVPRSCVSKLSLARNSEIKVWLEKEKS